MVYFFDICKIYYNTNNKYQMKKRILFFLLLAVFTAAQSFASDFNDGVLNYTIISGTTNVQVDGLVNTSTASVTILATVTNPSDGKTYNVTSIGISAFYNCSGLTSIDLSAANSLQTIGDKAFFGCENLTSVTIPSSVTSIGFRAFYYCTGLTSIDLSAATGLQTIGFMAFSNCSSAKFITTTGTSATPVKYDDLTSIEDYAFQNCKGLTTFDISGATNLTTIGEGAFNGCSSLTSVTIPSSVTSIGASAFNGCSSLTSVTIPSSVTSIGERAFKDCSGLTSIDLSNANGLQTIGGYAFYNSNATFTTTTGSSATAVKYDALTSIGDYAFTSCSGLTTFDMSGATNLTSIGDNAFSTSGLTSVTIPASVTFIGGSAFSYCTGLTSITIPASVTSIGNSAFSHCTGLTSATIPASVTSIGEYAFYYCTGLTSIDLSATNKLQTIGEEAFSYCSAAKFITTTGSSDTPVKYDALTSIGVNAFYGCSGLKDFDMSGATNLTAIGDAAFCKCSGLTSVTIPASVTSIGKGAFYLCSGLTSVTIPASVTSISGSAFYYCSKLSTVYLEPTTPPSLGTDIFAYCKSDIKFYINDGTTDKANISAYISATSAWTYGKIIDSNAVPYLPKKVTEAKVATLYLPYEVDIPEGITAYYCSGKATDYISMTKLEGGVIPANTPVYLTATDAATFNFIANGKSTPAVTKDDILKGLTADLTVITGNTYLTLGKASDDTYGFYKYTGTTIAANTCYIEYSGSAAKGFNISFDGSTTGINEAAAPANAGKRMIYDLQGRRVTSPVKGIYIINGKKVIF